MNKKNMHNIVTVYRFNTPLLEKEKETEKLLMAVECMINYLKNEALRVEIGKKKTNGKLQEIIDFGVGYFVLNFNSFKDKEKSIIFPIFKFDIYLNRDFISKNRKNVVYFLTNIFECFDGVNEKEYLIDIDENIYYKKNFFSRKQYPAYDFQNISSIYKTFKKNNGSQLLENFIKKYRNGFVLNMETAEEYHKVNAYLLFFIYLLYVMHHILYKVDENLDFLDNVEAGEYAGHIKLQKERLKLLGGDTKRVYEKHLVFLKNFLELFEK